jgi:hypothetical protein
MRTVLVYLLILIGFASCKKSTTSDDAAIDISSGTWHISYFWDVQDKTSAYSSYNFMFLAGGTFMAHGSSTTVTGTWSQTTTSININFTDAALSDINGSWLKTEFMNTSIKLKDDNPSQDDRLYFVKN